MQKQRFYKAIHRLILILKWYLSKKSTTIFKKKLDNYFVGIYENDLSDKSSDDSDFF